MKLDGAKFFDTEASEDEAEGDGGGEEEEEEEKEDGLEENGDLDGFIADEAEPDRKGFRPIFNDESDEEIEALKRRFAPSETEQTEPAQEEAPTEEEDEVDEPEDEENSKEKIPEIQIAGQIHKEEKPVVKIKQTKFQKDLVLRAQQSFSSRPAKVSDDEEEAEVVAAQKKEKAQLKLKVLEEQSAYAVQLDGSSREMLSKIKKTNISRTLSFHSKNSLPTPIAVTSSAAPSAGPLNFADLNKELSVAKKLPMMSRQSSFLSLSIDNSVPARDFKTSKPAAAKPIAAKPIAAKNSKMVIFRTNSMSGHSLTGSEDSKSKSETTVESKSQVVAPGESSDFSAFLTRPSRTAGPTEKFGRNSPFERTLSGSGFMDKAKSLGSAELSRSLPSRSLSDLTRSLTASLSNERSRGANLQTSLKAPSPTVKKTTPPTGLKGVLAFKSTIKNSKK